jgi:hypothetical protein
MPDPIFTGLESVLGLPVISKLITMFDYKASALVALFPDHNTIADIAGWDVYRMTRGIAQPNVRDGVSNSQGLDPIRNVKSSLIHLSDSALIPSEMILALRSPGTVAEQDARGFIGRKAKSLANMHARTREFFMARALTGKFTVTGKVKFTVDFGRTASHSPTPTTDWSNPDADIPADIEAWKDLIRQDAQTEASDMFFNLSVKNYIKNNSKVKEYLGENEWRAQIGREGMISRLSGLNLHQVDAGFKPDGGVYTKFIDDNVAIIVPPTEEGWAENQVGEVAVANLNQAVENVRAPAGYMLVEGDPAGYKLVRKDCFLPVLYVPDATVGATVVKKASPPR